MKTRTLITLVFVAVLIVAQVTPVLAIQVCYDYVSYRLTGIDPAPPGRPEKAYLDYKRLTDLLREKHYAPLSTPPTGQQLEKGDVIFLPGHVGIANGPDNIDHFIIVQGTSTKGLRYDPRASQPQPIALPPFEQQSGKVGGLYRGDTLSVFRMRQFSAQRSGIPSSYEVWRQSGKYVKGRLLTGPVNIPAKNATPTDVGLMLETGKAYFVVGQGTNDRWS